jgi:hypothetical protein
MHARDADTAGAVRPRGSYGHRPVEGGCVARCLRCGPGDRSGRRPQKRGGYCWNRAGALGDELLPKYLSSTFPIYP